MGNDFLQRHEYKYCLAISNTLTNNSSSQFGIPSLVSLLLRLIFIIRHGGVHTVPRGYSIKRIFGLGSIFQAGTVCS